MNHFRTEEIWDGSRFGPPAKEDNTLDDRGCSNGNHHIRHLAREPDRADRDSFEDHRDEDGTADGKQDGGDKPKSGPTETPGEHAAQHHKFTCREIEDFGDEVDETPAYSDYGVDASARYSRNRILDDLREKSHQTPISLKNMSLQLLSKQLEKLNPSPSSCSLQRSLETTRYSASSSLQKTC